MTDHRRVRVLFCDHLNLARGKYLPTRYASGVCRHCISLFALGFDREMTPAPGSLMLEGLPDLDAVYDLDAVRPGWEPDTGVVVADLQRHGEPLGVCSRTVLKRAVADWAALGHRVQVGIELEAFIFQPDGSGGWVPYDTPGAYVYGTGMAVDPHGLIDEIWRTAEVCDLPVESLNSEYDSPQFELTLHFDDAVKAVDDIFLFRTMAKEVVARRGFLLSFMPKPLSDRGGSGLHVNMSLVGADGTNALADPSSDDGLSTLAHRCIAGMLAHHEGMAGLLAPTVNSYKRLRPAQLSGFWCNWGHDHRGVTVRIPNERGAATRIEHRMADCSANPYVATAAVLQAARLGVVGELTPPPPEDLDALENVSTERSVPETLGAALEALEADTALVEAVGPELVANLVANKRREWERYLAHTTDWEMAEYLHFV